MSKTLRVRYIIFILTVTLVIIGNGLILEYNMGLQDADAAKINIAGRQRMLSQKISKNILYIEKGLQAPIPLKPTDSLSKYIGQFVDAHTLLKEGNSNAKETIKIDSLFGVVEKPFNSIVNIGRQYFANNRSNKPVLINTLIKEEQRFIELMEKIVYEYQTNAELQLSKTKKISLILTIISILLLLGEFLFLVLPFQKALILQNEQLSNANRKLTDFANITSHNLRAPLGNFMTLLKFFKTSTDDEDREDLLDKLELVSKHMNETMNVLLNAVSVQKSTDQIEKEPIRFESVSKRIKENLSSQIEESGATIKEDFTDATEVNYHPLYLESIMLNLMTNSIKFRNPERPLEIMTTTIQKGKKIVLRHSDNGRGLNMKRYGDKLFGMNKVFHKNTDSKGVGLFMTRMQIEAMGGTIHAESEPDKGMTFIIEF